MFTAKFSQDIAMLFLMSILMAVASPNFHLVHGLSHPDVAAKVAGACGPNPKAKASAVNSVEMLHGLLSLLL